MRSPEKFHAARGKLPKGLLLVGPPGRGKTMLARAVAGEAQVPFFYTSGSEFEEMFVGVGARRVRDLFKAAKQAALHRLHRRDRRRRFGAQPQGPAEHAHDLEPALDGTGRVP